MKTRTGKTCIRLDDDEVTLLIILMESMIGGPVWRRNERESYGLLRKIEDSIGLPRR